MYRAMINSKQNIKSYSPHMHAFSHTFVYHIKFDTHTHASIQTHTYTHPYTKEHIKTITHTLLTFAYILLHPSIDIHINMVKRMPQVK